MSPTMGFNHVKHKAKVYNEPKHHEAEEEEEDDDGVLRSYTYS